MMKVQVKDDGKSECSFVMKEIEIEFCLVQKTKPDNIISGESPADFPFGCFITRNFVADF